MLLRAYTVDGEPVNFTLQDCPVYVDADKIVLARIRYSKVLRASTIIRGDESAGCFEGDIVCSNNKPIGVVVYSSGFLVQTFEGPMKDMKEVEHISLLEGSISTILDCVKSENRTELLFKCSGKEIYLSLFLQPIKDNKIAVSGSSFPGKSIDPNTVRFFTGRTDQDGKRIYFGDIYKGGVVVLNQYIPMIKVGSEFKII